MNGVLARLGVLLKAAPTYLTIAATVVTIIVSELADKIPGDGGTIVAKVGGIVIVVIGAAVSIVRRVTPVVESQRGLLVPPDKTEPPA